MAPWKKGIAWNGPPTCRRTAYSPDVASLRCGYKLWWRAYALNTTGRVISMEEDWKHRSRERAMILMRVRRSAVRLVLAGRSFDDDHLDNAELTWKVGIVEDDLNDISPAACR